MHLIPGNSWVCTTLAGAPDQRVNIEIDPQTQVIVDTVERLLVERGLLRRGWNPPNCIVFLSHSLRSLSPSMACAPSMGRILRLAKD